MVDATPGSRPSFLAGGAEEGRHGGDRYELGLVEWLVVELSISPNAEDGAVGDHLPFLVCDRFGR